MDDLDHSVLIAEQDWDCFFTESEECSVQQVRLAVLDDSSLSDSDDDHLGIGSTISTGQRWEEEREDRTHDQAKEGRDESSESDGLNSLKTESQDLDSGRKYVDSELSERVESDENSRNIQCRASPSPCVEEMDNQSNSDLDAIMVVADSSPATKNEKERWFVTVNDNPVCLRDKPDNLGQKKRRKKKPSKNVNPNSDAEPESCFFSSKNQTTDSDVSSTIKNRHHQGGKSANEEKKTNQDLSLTVEQITDIPDHKSAHNTTQSSFDYLQDQNCGSEGQEETGLFSHVDGQTEESIRFILGSSTPPALTHTEIERTHQEHPGQSRTGEQSSRVEFSVSDMNPPGVHGPTPPIFAISSFWDEMEKLTINDILQLRVSNRVLMTDSLGGDAVDADPQDSSEVESKDPVMEDQVDDAADSDYFTHLDDSKPDRSSCEFSTYSDFDDEFLQLLQGSSVEGNEQSNDQEDDSDQSLLSNQYVAREIIQPFPEHDLLKCTRRHDALFLPSNTKHFLLDHCEIRNSTPSPVLSISDILDDKCLPYMFEILTTEMEQQQYLAWTPDVLSLPLAHQLSMSEAFLPEGNGYHFLSQSTKTETTMVPIYSSSHSVVKDLAFSEVEEILHSDIEDKIPPFQTSPHFSSIQTRCASPSGAPNPFWNISNQRNAWRYLSMKHLRFSVMGRTWCRTPSMFSFSKSGTSDTVCLYDSRTSNSSKPPIFMLENNMETTASESESEGFPFSLKQADMCLVCIAFASWVLKSSNPQSTDMWKAALLANVSAISAIQYLRQYIKEE